VLITRVGPRTRAPSEQLFVALIILVHEPRVYPTRTGARRGRTFKLPNPHVRISDYPTPHRLSHGQRVPRKEQNSCQNQCSSCGHATITAFVVAVTGLVIGITGLLAEIGSDEDADRRFATHASTSLMK
jgi:hypothetical protein